MVIADTDDLFDPLDKAGPLGLRFGFRFRLGHRLLVGHFLALPFKKPRAGSAEGIAVLIFKTTTGTDDHSAGSFRVRSLRP